MVVSTQMISEGPFYAECLGEEVASLVEVTIYRRLFETPSGVGHYSDNWRMQGYLRGLTTGRIWFGKGFSPWVENGVTGERGVINIRTSVHWKPFNDNGSFPSFPDLRFAWRAKLTVNANGEVTVAVPIPEASDAFTCFGTGY